MDVLLYGHSFDVLYRVFMHASSKALHIIHLFFTFCFTNELYSLILGPEAQTICMLDDTSMEVHIWYA